jgi:carbonic anhydrase
MILVPAFVVGLAAVASAVTPDEALEMLMSGNQQFVQGNLANLQVNSKPKVRNKLAASQHPYAIVLDCSDSRVSPEIIFDKGLGEIFVVRVAGNVVAPHELGSIEYAIEHLGSSLLMVLGHSKCGAVNATVGQLDPLTCTVSVPEGNIGSLIESIAPAVEQSCLDNAENLLKASIDANVELVASTIESQSPILEEYLQDGRIKLVKARYDHEDGIVKLLDE